MSRMPKRKRLTKEQRIAVYYKFAGHCTYCGCEIDLSNMQVDHIKALERGGTDDMDNLYPACRSCNKYKDTLTIEDFRQRIENMHDVLMRDNVTYKNAVRFRQIIPNKHRPVFYFEKDGERNA